MINAYRRRRYARRLAAEWTVQVVGMAGGAQHFAYDLSQAIPMRPGVLYRTLTRLEQKGLVRTGWEDKPVNPRRWYQLTDEAMREVSARVLGSSPAQHLPDRWHWMPEVRPLVDADGDVIGPGVPGAWMVWCGRCGVRGPRVGPPPVGSEVV